MGPILRKGDQHWKSQDKRVDSTVADQGGACKNWSTDSFIPRRDSVDKDDPPGRDPSTELTTDQRLEQVRKRFFG